MAAVWQNGTKSMTRAVEDEEESGSKSLINTGNIKITPKT